MGILKVLSIHPNPLKSKALWIKTNIPQKDFQTICRTLFELKLVSKPKFGHYEINHLGQETLNRLRGSKC
jgi:predicted transcriptional regulator